VRYHPLSWRQELNPMATARIPGLFYVARTTWKEDYWTKSQTTTKALPYLGMGFRYQAYV